MLGTLGYRNLIVSVVNFIAILNFRTHAASWEILSPVPVCPWMLRDVKPG